jgi:general secretion pathway protein J
MNERGFTLLEIMIATALTVIILGAIYNTLSMTERARSSRGEGLTTLEEARRGLETLTMEIESLVYDKDDPSTGFTLRDFDIEGIPLSEVSFTTLSNPRNIPIRVTYLPEMDKTGLVLKKILTPHSGEGHTYRVDMLRNLKSFRLQVEEGDQRVPVWETGRNGRLPKGLTITIGIEYNGREIKLERKVHPRITV